MNDVATRFSAMTGQGWPLLVAAILFEVAGTICMKLADGFSQSVPSVLMFVFYALCLCSLELALNSIELNVVYAVWSGLGTTLVALIGIVWFKEPVTTTKIASMALIVLGVIGLNLKLNV